MKNILFVTLLLLFAGCKFESPLTEKPTREVDQALIGSWFSLEDGSPLDIYQVSAFELLVIDGGAPYICAHSDFSGIAFISCRQIKNNKEYYGKYAYVAYRIEDGELLRYSLSDALGIDEDTTSSSVVREAIEKALKSPIGLEACIKLDGRFRKKP